jgi:hypothetical protein
MVWQTFLTRTFNTIKLRENSLALPRRGKEDSVVSTSKLNAKLKIPPFEKGG